jgi:hypothetical protein
MKRWVIGLLIFLFLHCGYVALAQGVFATEKGEAGKQVLSLPFPFYNEKFGAAAGYVYGVTGYPQQPSAILTTVMAGTHGSVMGFLRGRDLQMPFFKFNKSEIEKEVRPC